MVYTNVMARSQLMRNILCPNVSCKVNAEFVLHMYAAVGEYQSSCATKLLATTSNKQVLLGGTGARS